MIPRQTLGYFTAVPDELLALCAPHRWEDLTSPPAPGLRSIRDILVHIVGAEQRWIHHAIAGQPKMSDRPEAFSDLDTIGRHWRPQRKATVALVQGLTAEAWHSRRPFHFDPSRTATVEEILWHVVTHEQYHRGQIFTRLALLGRRDLPDLDLLR